MLCDALQEAKIVEIYFNKTSIQLLKKQKKHGKSRTNKRRFIESGTGNNQRNNREDIIRRMEEEVSKGDGDSGLEDGLLRRRKMLRDALQNKEIRILLN